jgi:hypothetical protein
MNATCCPNCNVRLTKTEAADGWCENCGKKMPAWMQRPEMGLKANPSQGLAARTTMPAAAAGEKMGVGTKILLVLFVVAIFVMIAGACAGDPKSIQAVAKIGAYVVVAGVFGLVAAFVRFLKGTSRSSQE